MTALPPVTQLPTLSAAMADSVDMMADNMTDYEYDYEYIMTREQYLEEFKKPWLADETFYFVVTVNCLSVVVGLVGNILVIVTLLGDRANRNVMSTFLVSLALADVLMLAVAVPTHTVRQFTESTPFGPQLCKISSFFEMMSAMASVLNLTAVSIERYYVILNPLKSRSWSVSRAKHLLLVIWAFAALLSAPELGTRDKFVMHPKVVEGNHTEVLAVYNCTEIEQWRVLMVVYRLVILFVLPAIVIIYCYGHVMRKLWQSSKDLQRMTAIQPMSNRSSAASHADAHAQYSAPSVNGTPRPTITIQLPSPPGSPRHPRHSAPGVVQHFQPNSPTATLWHPPHLATRDHRNSFAHDYFPQQTDAVADAILSRRQVIKMMLYVIVLFLVCWGPRLIFNLLTRLQLTTGTGSPQLTMYWLRAIFNGLVPVHSALNPIVYLVCSAAFRARLVATLCRSKKRPGERCGSTGYIPVTTHTNGAPMSRSSSDAFQFMARSRTSSTGSRTGLGPAPGYRSRSGSGSRSRTGSGSGADIRPRTSSMELWSSHAAKTSLASRPIRLSDPPEGRCGGDRRQEVRLSPLATDCTVDIHDGKSCTHHNIQNNNTEGRVGGGPDSGQ